MRTSDKQKTDKQNDRERQIDGWRDRQRAYRCKRMRSGCDLSDGPQVPSTALTARSTQRRARFFTWRSYCVAHNTNDDNGHKQIAEAIVTTQY